MEKEIKISVITDSTKDETEDVIKSVKNAISESLYRVEIIIKIDPI